MSECAPVAGLVVRVAHSALFRINSDVLAMPSLPLVHVVENRTRRVQHFEVVHENAACNRERAAGVQLRDEGHERFRRRQRDAGPQFCSRVREIRGERLADDGVRRVNFHRDGGTPEERHIVSRDRADERSEYPIGPGTERSLHYDDRRDDGPESLWQA